MQLSPLTIHTLSSGLFNSYAIDVLRLDAIHPIVSGNKWFKLKYSIAAAIAAQKDTVATFGGAYSNHIIATAFACRDAGLKAVGIIRGEKSTNLSHTLQSAMELGMELVFVPREEYRQKDKLVRMFDSTYYWINEGGYGVDGMKGASEILQAIDTANYTHILCACGTGTMMAGLVMGALPHQHVIGISVLKGHTGLLDDVKKLLPEALQEKQLQVLHGYHFGGYAKHPPALICWMQQLWQAEKLPTDIVYTSKLLYAVSDLCKQHFFEAGSRLLVIHSGGLQGNNSLPVNTLPF